jgi:hypothetical protein
MAETQSRAKTGRRRVWRRMRLNLDRFTGGRLSSWPGWGERRGERGQDAFEVGEKGWGAFALGHVDIDEGGDLGGEADVGGEEKYGDGGFAAAHVGGDVATVHAGHGVVEDDGVDGVGVEELEAGGAVGGGEDAVTGALEEDAADLEANLFVVDAEHEIAVG